MLDRSRDDERRTASGPMARGSRSRTRGPASARRSRSAPDLARVRAVIEALPEAVFVTEPDGELRLTNPAADRLFAGEPIVDRADLLSRFERVRPSPSPSTGPDGGASVTVRPRDQPNRWFALRAVELDADGAGLHQVAAPSNDVAADPNASRPAIPRDRRRHAATDGRELAVGERVGRTVFVLRDVTDTRDLRPIRDAFLSVLSHELRTPITTIYAGSSVLARRPALSAPATQTLARDISSEAARLYDLVEDLLVLARLERRILEPLAEPVLLQRAVDATIRLIGDRVTGARIVRRGESDAPPIRGDATYVEQACRDLILGSLRYAGEEPGTELTVDLRSDPEAGEVGIAVLDRGPRLAPEELLQAFELPDPSATGRMAGSGVGPFVCRHLVEAMGGRTWARNRPDGGVEMGFALRIDDQG
jgi:signal transduction histidine kinase